jgi:hypothetical protein
MTDFRQLIPLLANNQVEYNLVRVKRAAGRPKDFEVTAELEAILEERKHCL